MEPAAKEGDLVSDKGRPTLFDEYQVVVQLIQDTGQTVWLINGAYLLAATVLLGALGSILADAQSGSLIVVRWGAVAGLLACLLWWGSFERAYGFYNLRIHYARRLERLLGFPIHELGRQLPEGPVNLEIPANGSLAAESYPIKMPWIGKRFSSQAWTRWLVVLFAILFGALFVLTWLRNSGKTC